MNLDSTTNTAATIAQTVGITLVLIFGLGPQQANAQNQSGYGQALHIDAPGNGSPNVMAWDESAGQFIPVDATDIPAAGQGFITYVYDDQDYDGTGEGFPKMLRTGPVTPQLSYTEGEASAAGWNMVANPYGATIDWDAADSTLPNGKIAPLAELLAEGQRQQPPKLGDHRTGPRCRGTAA